MQPVSRVLEDASSDLARQPNDGMIEVASQRAAQEVQSAMIIARKFPRDETVAYQKIITACKRKGLAESAVYEYPRGTEKVSGPSIRLAETMARAWGNIDFGVIELEQRLGESSVLAYAWDLETNTRQTKVFTVKHERHTRLGVTKLTDPRDIYEMAANQGARRLRACIIGIIPGDVVDDAVSACERTMSGDNKEPLSDRVRKMATAFAEYQVTIPMIEAKLGHRLDATTEHELARLRRIFVSLRDGMASREQHFDIHAGTSGTAKPVGQKTQEMDQAFAESQKPPPSDVAPAEPPVSPPVNGATSEAVAPSDADVLLPNPPEANPVPEQASISASEDLSSWTTFYDLAADAASTRNIAPSKFTKGVGLALLNIRMKGKEEKTAVAWREQLLGSIRADTFNWDTGKIGA